MTNNAEREVFVREDRYIVLKIRDVKDALSSLEICELERILKRVDGYRKTTNRIPLVCVVVESDWPEYESVWAMIEARMTGKARAQASGVPDTCKYCFGSGRQMNDSGELVPCNCKTATPPKSASVPVERLETFISAWRSKSIPYSPADIMADDIEELIAEYKA